MANLAIKGHATRGEEVIEILEMLGGKNKVGLFAKNETLVYFIKNGVINNTCMNPQTLPFKTFTLEEFLEKFPYKIGDKVRFSDSNTPFTISRIWWDNNASELICTLEEQDIDVSSVDLQTYKEQTMEETIQDHSDKEGEKKSLLTSLIEYFRTTPKDKLEREWNEHNELDKIGPTVEEYVAFVESIKKQPKYPTTYEECCKVLGYKQLIIPKSMMAYNITLLGAFQKLLVCRDAYYVIAKEQMRLGKPWKQDYDDMRFIIRNDSGYVHTYEYHGSGNVILAFPTAEMRDAFYENFKDLIETCKGLL